MTPWHTSPHGRSTCARRRRSASRAGPTASSSASRSSCGRGTWSGMGESAPNARYGEERQRDLDLLADLAPEIADLEGPAAVEAYCESLAAQGLPALRAGLSAAAWDLAGKQAGEPVWRMLGLARPSVRTSYTIAVGAPEEMLAQARAASAFGTLKVKLGLRRRPRGGAPAQARAAGDDLSLRRQRGVGPRAGRRGSRGPRGPRRGARRAAAARRRRRGHGLAQGAHAPAAARRRGGADPGRPRRRGRRLRRRGGQAGQGGGHRRRLRPHLRLHASSGCA